jgi:hypothetical protein
MSAEVLGADSMIARAAQRTQWASRALAAASEDLRAAARGEAIVLEESAEQVAGLARLVAQLEARA